MRERRAVSRYALGLTGRLHPPQGGTGTNVVVRMISTRGCEIEGGNGPATGRKCELYFDWRDAHIGVEAEVVWKDPKGRVGLRFLSVDQETQQRLTALCATLSRQPMPAGAPETPGTTEPRPPSVPLPAEKAAPVPGPAPQPPPKPTRERRRVPRYISELRAHISIPATGMTARVKLITLSVLGGCLEGRSLPEAGASCDLNTEWDGHPLRLPAEVVWKSKGDRAGLKFATLDAATEQVLRQICSNLRLQPMAPLPPEPA
jgi:hypothetical protein